MVNKMNLKINLEYYPKLKDEPLTEDIKVINQNKKNWQHPFFIDTESYIDLEEIRSLSSRFLDTDVKNIIILGTGGSIQTLSALSHLAKKTIYPITSSRAVELNECLKNTDPENSVVIPISRSGETLDVNSTIGTYIKKGYQFLGLSSRGTMNDLLKKIGATILEVPDLSGRFAASITNVAIVPAFLAGINIEQFLDGLKEGYDEFMTFHPNPSIEFASFLYHLYQKGYKVVFSMPYSKNLEGSIGLFVQEISESTGKEGKGFMGAYQEAPLCQHSVLEYILGGTKGAVVPVIYTVKDDISDFQLESSIDYVDGKTAQTVVNYQADATFQAMIDQAVPCAKLSLNNPREQLIGNLVAFIQSTVYYLCLLLDVNWANNPKVDIGKKICNEALQNNLSEEQRKENRVLIAENKFKKFFE
ncbi:MAG: Glucose-6-phosphate isomerase [Promethearchaeota archaeon]|nr:MAG: Glucose-6-phosphate isomerase [Candidatus Lokiarchaeota archaeon]